MLYSILIYVTCFLVSLFFAMEYVRQNDASSRSKLWLVLIAIPPIIVSGFRNGVGIDYYSYLESYNAIKELGISYIFKYYQEPLWYLLNYISLTPRIMYILSSSIFCFFVIAAIDRCKSSCGFTFPLFIFYCTFYLVSFNGIRQAIACAIVLYAITHIEDNRPLFVALVILAFLFHKSAIVVLLLLLISDRKKTLPLFGVGVAFVTVFMGGFVSVIVSILNRFSFYSGYISEPASENAVGFWLYILPVVAILVLMFFMKDEVPNGASRLFKLFLLQIPFQQMGKYLAYADRIAEYFLLCQVLLVPLLLSSFSDRSNKYILKSLMLCWYIFYFVIMFVVLNSNGVFPYNF